MHRAERAGFKAIVVTLDTWITGWRPRDLATSNFPQLRGLCLANYTSDPVFRSRLAQPPEENPMAAVAHWAGIFGNPLTWDDLPWLRSLTKLPLILKGICHPDDARRALDAGADGIYVSNHGGRQANGGLPALDCLPGVVEAAAGRPVLFDSGVRSGADIIKALALGATAVGIGRPYAYGLALGGARGIEHVLRTLLAEADLIMAVDGYPPWPTSPRTRCAGSPRSERRCRYRCAASQACTSPTWFCSSVRWPSSSSSRASTPGICPASQAPCDCGTNWSCLPCSSSTGTEMADSSNPHGLTSARLSPQ